MDGQAMTELEFYESELPHDQTELDRIVRLAVGHLHLESAQNIVYDAGAQASARYLTGALVDPQRTNIAMTILEHFGPSRATITPLMRAFGDSERTEAICDLLIGFGPFTATANSLVGYLGDDGKVEAAEEVLLVYGPSETTVRPLIRGLVDSERATCITDILIEYGPCPVTVNPLVGLLADEERRDAAKHILLAYGPSETTLHPLVVAMGDTAREDIIVDVLREYGAEHVSCYIANKLRSPKRRRPATRLLQAYGLNEYTIGPILGAFTYPDSRAGAMDVLLSLPADRRVTNKVVGMLGGQDAQAAEELLIAYGPSRETAYPLVGALGDSVRRETASRILVAYGPRKNTVHPLLAAMRDPLRGPIVESIMMQYGKRAVRHIQASKLGKEYYVQQLIKRLQR